MAISLEKENSCIEGRNRHRFQGGDTCVHCGYTRKYVPKKTDKAPVRAKSGPSKTKVKQSVMLLIGGAQMIVLGLDPDLMEDALSQDEILLLADALADEIDGSPRLKSWLVKVQQASPHAKLIVAVISILVPRLVRRGFLPEGSDEVVKATLSMAAGRTHGSDWGDGEREIDFDSQPVTSEETLSGNQDEAGRREVSSTNGYIQGEFDFEPEVRPVRA